MTDRDFMPLAIDLAARGRGFVEPNPMVGAVIVTGDRQIAGCGFHERFGGPHAEVVALNHAGDRARGGTLYVTLEPCCHWGKTPPCTDALIRAGLSRVVVAMRDPFPPVDGGGLARLREAGIQVDLGEMQADAERLNAPYLTRLRHRRPYAIAKWAMSLDGKIATSTGDSRWISSPQARESVHELRGRVDGIMVGAGTVRRDDPRLTARPPGSRVAARIVATRSGRLPDSCELVKTIDQAPVIVWTTADGADRLGPWQMRGAEIRTDPSLGEFLAVLADRGFTNLLVEGGGQLHGTFHDLDLIDEIHAYIGTIVIGGDSAPTPVGGRGHPVIADAAGWESPKVQTYDGTLLVQARRSR